MKSKILCVASLVLMTSGANASGLYFGAGYSNSTPKLIETQLSSYSDDVLEGGRYENFHQYIETWPTNHFNTINKLGETVTNPYYHDTCVDGSGNPASCYFAKPWDAGFKESNILNLEKSSSTSFSVGWDFAQSPFRIELEKNTIKTQFLSYDKVIYTGQTLGWIEVKPDGTIVEVADIDYPGAEAYVMNVGDQPVKIGVDTMMLNTYFEIPGFGAIDPYIGMGVGFAKMDVNGQVRSDNLLVGQIMAGVEYRIKDTAWIVGLEYRKLKFAFLETVDASTEEFENNSVMFKVRYDFISNEY